MNNKRRNRNNKQPNRQSASSTIQTCHFSVFRQYSTPVITKTKYYDKYIKIQKNKRLLCSAISFLNNTKIQFHPSLQAFYILFYNTQ